MINGLNTSVSAQPIDSLGGGFASDAAWVLARRHADFSRPQPGEDAAIRPPRQVHEGRTGQHDRSEPALSDLAVRITKGMLYRPPQQTEGPLTIVLLIPAEAAAEAGTTPHDRVFRRNFKHRLRDEQITPWRDEMRRVAPDLACKIKYNFDYKGSTPSGAKGRDYSRAYAEVDRMADDVARYIVRKNAAHPGRLPINSRTMYLVVVPEMSDPRATIHGASVPNGSLGFFSLAKPRSFAHEMGHKMNADHDHAGYGLFNWGSTFMSRPADGFFSRPRYSDANTLRIRQTFHLDPQTGRKLPRVA